jgi:hypothetical protein
MQQLASARPQAAARGLRRGAACAPLPSRCAPALAPRRARRAAAAAADNAESVAAAEEEVDLEDQVELFMKRQAELESGGAPHDTARRARASAGMPPAPGSMRPRPAACARMRDSPPPRPGRRSRRAAPLQPHSRARATPGRSSAATSFRRRCAPLRRGSGRCRRRCTRPMLLPSHRVCFGSRAPLIPHLRPQAAARSLLVRPQPTNPDPYPAPPTHPRRPSATAATSSSSCGPSRPRAT